MRKPYAFIHTDISGAERIAKLSGQTVNHNGLRIEHFIHHIESSEFAEHAYRPVEATNV